MSWTWTTMTMNRPKPDTIPPNLIDEIIDEQRRRWSQGERVLVEAYLQRLPTLAVDPGIILDLIYNEIVLREKAGDRPQQQEYFQRFPHLAGDLTLQFEVDGGLDWQMIADTAPTPESVEAKPTHTPAGATPFPSLHGYNITGIIGRGATGVVYKARQLSQDRSVAVKVVLASVPAQATALAELHAQADKLAALHHPYICPIHEVGIDAGRLFIAQERVETSLARTQAESTVPPRQAAQWIEILASTMHDIHRQGIIHGNLTLANVLVSFNGILKITDIGLARFVNPNTRRGVLGPADDVFSLGAILRAICMQKSTEVPRDLETIYLRCLQPDSAERYDSAAALADDLTAFLMGRPIRARRPGLVQRAVHAIRNWRSSSRNDADDVPQRRHADTMQLIFEIACRLMRCTRRDELLCLLAESSAWLMNAEKVTIFMIDRERSGFWTRMTTSTGVEEMRSPLDAGIPGTVAATKQPLHIADGSGDPRLATKTHNLLALPLLDNNGDVMGVVQTTNKAGGTFSAADVETLTNLLTAAAIAIEHAK